MAKLIGFRLLLAVPQLLIIVLLAFSLTYLVPGSPAAAIAGDTATAEQIAELETKLGLDRPVHERLGEYLSGAVHGDLGTSYRSQRQVTDVLWERLPATLSMVVGGVFVAIIVGFSLGIIAGTQLDRLPDRIVMVATSVAVALPQFLVGLLLLLLVSVKLGWVPVVAYVPFTEDPLLWARGIALPSLSLGIPMSALIGRQMRTGMAAAVSSNYAASLAAAGVSRRRFYFRYGIKNAMVPVLAAIGISFAILVGASFVLERVFSIPGIGDVLLASVVSKDFPIVQGGVVVIAIIVILLNIFIDIAYGLVNPRTRPQ